CAMGVRGGGRGPLDQNQVLLGVDRVHAQTDLRHPLCAHVTRHPHALEHARRRRRGTDRARLADVVRAVRRRTAAEVVPLDRPGEALSDRDAGNLDPVAWLEALHRDSLARGELARAADLDQPTVGADAVLAQVAQLRLRQLAFGDLVVGELDGVVTVRVLGPHGDDRAGPGLNHRYRRDAAWLLVEDLRPPNLSAHDPFHGVTA